MRSRMMQPAPGQPGMGNMRGSHAGAPPGPHGDSAQSRMPGPPHQQMGPHPSESQNRGGPPQGQPQMPPQQQQAPPGVPALNKNKIAPVEKPKGLDPIEMLKERENRYLYNDGHTAI